MTKNRKAPAEPDDRFSLIKNKKLLSLYAALLECRKVAAAAPPPRRRSKLVAGMEAAVVGLAIDLEPADTVATTLWPEALVRAVSPSARFIEILAPANEAPPSSDPPHAPHRAVIVAFVNGDEKGRAAWQKTLAHAIAEKLPILFVAMHGEKELGLVESHSAAESKEQRPALPTIHVDGSDVVAVYRVASESIAHARRGNGPTLVECMREKGADAVVNMTQYLRHRGFSIEP